MKIRLSKELYEKEAILGAIDAFKEVAEIMIVEDSFLLEISPKDESKREEIKDEFCNYALGLTKEMRF